MDAQWMIQEVPKQRNHVLLVITNRALYLLETSRLGGVCQVSKHARIAYCSPTLAPAT